MHEATRLAVPYLLIMGYKEVMENAVLVRDTRTNAQATVPIEDLVGYLKRRRVVTV
jgi:histidyl-tRNA synthetase